MVSNWRHVLLLVLIALLFCASSFGQGTKATTPSSTRVNPSAGITRQQADEILRELREIRGLLEKQQNGDSIASELRLMRQVMERQAQAQAVQAAPPQGPPPPQRVKFNLQGGQSIGNPNAPVVLVEFADYQCPFCRNFHTDAFQQLKKNYIDTGKMRFISHDLPLEFHSQAMKAAQAARCAAEQQKFWDMRDLLIRNADKLAPEAFSKFGQQLGLNMDQFRACTAGEKYFGEIQKESADANAIGISGTPSFVLGKADGESVDGIVLVGAQPFAIFDNSIKQQLGDWPTGD